MRRGEARGWRGWVRLAYGAALVVTAAAVLVLRRDDVGALVDGTRPGPLIAALGLGFVSLGQSAWFWSRCLAGLGAPRATAEVLEATVAALPARYLPGSIWYAAGRVAYLRQSGSPTVTLSVVAILETLLSFVVAVALGLGLLLASGSDDRGLSAAALVTAAVGLAVLASPPVVNPVVGWVATRRGLGPVPAMRWGTYLELVAQLIAFWAASTAAFLCYLAAFPAIDTDGAVRTAGTFLLAWAAGFVAVFAPQGAGVFEATLASTLTGAPLAALALVLGGYRALTAVRDALALLALVATRTATTRGRGS